MNTSVTGSKGTGGRWRGGARRPSATRMSGRGSAPASSPGLPRLSHGSDSRRRARHGGTALPGFRAALGFVTTRLLGAPLLIAAWELSLGGYLLVRGFGPDAVASLPPPGGTR